MTPGVFISFSTKDQHTATALCSGLESRGLPCWIAPRNVRPGRAYAEEIVAGLRAAKVVVVMLSSNSNASQHVSREIEFATTHGIPVIPIRIENVVPGDALSFFLSSVQWFDALDGLGPVTLDAFAEVLTAFVPPLAPVVDVKASHGAERKQRRVSWVLVAVLGVLLSFAIWAAYAVWQQSPTHPTSAVDPATSPQPDERAQQTDDAGPSRPPAVSNRGQGAPPTESSAPKVKPPQSARCSQLLERVSLGETLSTDEQSYLRQNCGAP